MNTIEPDPVAAPARLIPPVPWGWRDLLAAIIVAAIGILTLNLVLVGVGLFLHLPLTENQDVLVIFLAVQDAIVVATAWLFSIVRYHVGWDRLGLRSFSVPMGCTLSLGLLLASYVARLIYGLIAVALGMHIQQQEVLTRLDTHGVGFILTLFVAAVIAPISEEIFFRGFLYGGLRRRIGVVGAMLVSTLFFTGLHLSFDLFIPIFLLGLFLAWLYEYTGSLYPGILLHAENNALSLILLFVLQALGQMPS
jgi:uncharacterized protein